MAFYNLASGLMTSSMVTAASEEVSFNQLLEMFKDSEQLATMAGSDKVLVTLFVAALGMSVTFAVLVFLWFCISMFAKVINAAQNAGSKKGEITEIAPVPQAQSLEEVNQDQDEDEELIAVISAAVAASMNTSIHNIVVRNIVSVDDHSPSWSKTGRIEQMNTRF